ncbi:hypothetical protein BpHYR1_040997 [Brachionus plicatilis]|uniref:Uncharacterized protein n=1 Tax=Brachionus plicatilis TaxID=10195 RepID=A0A3M7PEQ4_BRAPC|nr:hypothetical protein BpHYR1_040997 [Brachionus plicatilis]
MFSMSFSYITHFLINRNSFKTNLILCIQLLIPSLNLNQKIHDKRINQKLSLNITILDFEIV